MTYEQKFAAAWEELQRTGMRERKFMPPVFKWLKRRGWKVRPPLYNTFLMNVLMVAAFCAVVWGGCMGVVFVLAADQARTDSNLWLLIANSAQLGLLMGGLVAGQLSYIGHKYKLTKWKNL